MEDSPVRSNEEWVPYRLRLKRLRLLGNFFTNYPCDPVEEVMFRYGNFYDMTGLPRPSDEPVEGSTERTLSLEGNACSVSLFCLHEGFLSCLFQDVGFSSATRMYASCVLQCGIAPP